MSKHYKSVRNGWGTDLIISEGKYLSIGKNGENVTIRGNGIVLAFDHWDQFVHAINVEKAAYCHHDDKDIRGIDKE